MHKSVVGFLWIQLVLLVWDPSWMSYALEQSEMLRSHDHPLYIIYRPSGF